MQYFAHHIVVAYLVCTACVYAAGAVYTPPEASADISDIKLEWRDEKRSRDVPVKIYYPNGRGPYPVIIFSHGLGGSRDGYEYLGKHWAGCGYVSVHVQHRGSDDTVWKGLPASGIAKAMQTAAADPRSALNRPLDIQFVIDELEKRTNDMSSPLGGRMNMKALAVAGHSFGGYTALAVAGQSFLLPNGENRQFQDSRVKAAVQMSAPAPAYKNEYEKQLGSIFIPVMHMTGTKDFVEILPQTKPADRRIMFDHMDFAETCLVIFIDGDHAVFSGGRRNASAEKTALDASIIRLVKIGTTAFWDAYVKDSVPAKEWLTGGGYAKLIGNRATFETKNIQ